MKTILDKDPFTGLTEWFNYDPVADEVTVYSEQRDAEIKQFLDYTQAIRNEPEISRDGIKGSFWRYASLPPIVQVELRNKGVDIFNPSHTKALLKAINEHYPYTKLTDKIHR